MTSVAWVDDLLGRKSDAEFLINFLSRKIDERGTRGAKRSFVLNIDAGWGHGKTYFLANLKTTLEETGYVVAYVNAWTDDHADDPLISVMSGIEAAVNDRSAIRSKKPLNKMTQIGGQVAAAAVKGLVKQAISRYAGDDAMKEISELIGATGADVAKGTTEEAAKKIGEIYDSEGKLLLEKFRLGQKTINEFKTRLEEVVAAFKPEYSKPLFVLVDELDRCRPLYAVALLERVKHLFEVDDVVFVLATDTDQLRHSIGALYGLNFDAGRYLLRFFDQTYRFEDPSVDAFVEQQFLDIDCTKLFGSPRQDPAKFAASAFKGFNLSLRDIEQCSDIIRNCVTAWREKTPLALIALVPLVIMQQQRMLVSYEQAQSRLEVQAGPRIQWYSLDFDVWENGSRSLLDGLPLFSHVVDEMCTHDLYRLATAEGGSANTQACRTMASKEINERFPRGVSPASPPVSLMRKYPALVRSVGRLVPS